MSLITHQGVNYEGTYVPIQSDPTATSLDTYSVPTGGTIENWSNTKKVTISEEDYAALVSAGTVDPNTIYFRPGANTLFPPVQDNGSATSLESGSLPTGQTITSYLNSNFVPFSLTPNTGVTIVANDTKAFKVGCLIFITALFTLDTATTGKSYVFAYVPSNYKPKYNMCCFAADNSNDIACSGLVVASDGALKMYRNGTQSANSFRFSCVYVLT